MAPICIETLTSVIQVRLAFNVKREIWHKESYLRQIKEPLNIFFLSRQHDASKKNNLCTSSKSLLPTYITSFLLIYSFLSFTSDYY